MFDLASGAPNFNAVLEPIMVSHLLVGRAIKGVTDREGFPQPFGLKPTWVRLRGYHPDTMEWLSGAGPAPADPSDCKRHRLLSGRRKLEFAVFRWGQVQSALRSFVARSLDLPLTASGPTAREAVKGLKHAVDQYLKYCTGTMPGGWGRQ